MFINWYHITTKQVGYPQPENAFGYVNKTYDTSNACLTCKNGLRQKDEFRFLTEPKATKIHLFGLHWVFDQVFIKTEVRDIFEKEKITGIEYTQPVIHKSSLPLHGFYQLRVENLISTGLYTENLTTEVCELPRDKKMLTFLKANRSKLAEGPFCGQVKYNFPQGQNCIKLKAEALNNKTDFVRLDYNFGSGGNSNKPIIISERVKRIIEKENWKGAYFQKIELV